jgi:L-lactate dehydrogenase
MRKVSLVGTGLVGSSFAYALMIRGLASELVLIDVNAGKAIGEVMDFNHGLSFTRPMKITAGDYADCAGSHVVVIAAGASQKPGESRLDLLARNAAIFRQIVPQVVRHNPDGIILIATNPVDILTYVSVGVSGLLPGRVIGSGTILDTSRFRFLLGQYYGVDARSVHAYIIGEHGDSEIPVWSLASIGGVRLQEFAPLKNKEYVQADMDGLFAQVRDAAYEIIRRKGATYYAIGLGLVSIVAAILGDYRRVVSVSTLMTGQHGVTDMCLSLPCVVGAHGVEEILTLNLDAAEESGFRASAAKLKSTLHLLDPS